jgi:DNA polymerase-3 subunit delta
MYLREFITKVEKSGIEPVYVLTGTDDFQKREALAAVCAKVFGGGDPGMNLVEFSGAETGVAELLDELRTVPLFGSRRLVVLEGAEKFGARKRQAAGEAEQDDGGGDSPEDRKVDVMEALGNYGKTPSPTATLAIVATEEIKGKNFRSRFSKLFPEAPVLEAQPVRGEDVAAWISSRARGLKIKLAPEAAGILKEYFGSDLSELESALEKLALLVGENDAVGRADVEGFIRRRVGYDVFQFTDAIGGRDLKRVLEMVGDIYGAGLVEKDGTRELNEVAIFQRLLPMVSWEFRRIFEARTLLDSGKSERDAVAALGGSPYAARKAVEHARPYTLADCRAAQDAILQADNMTKTGGRPDTRLALEECLIKALGAWRQALPAGRPANRTYA